MWSCSVHRIKRGRYELSVQVPASFVARLAQMEWSSPALHADLETEIRKAIFVSNQIVAGEVDLKLDLPNLIHWAKETSANSDWTLVIPIKVLVTKE